MSKRPLGESDANEPDFVFLLSIDVLAVCVIQPLDNLSHTSLRLTCRALFNQLDNDKRSIPTEICDIIAEEGWMDLLQWAVDLGYPYGEWTCAYAALGGYLDMLQWLRNKNCRGDKWTFICAALGCHLDVVKWAHANECPTMRLVCSCAFFGTDMDVMAWTHSNICTMDDRTCWITNQDQLDCILRDCDVPYTSDARKHRRLKMEWAYRYFDTREHPVVPAHQSQATSFSFLFPYHINEFGFK